MHVHCRNVGSLVDSRQAFFKKPEFDFEVFDLEIIISFIHHDHQQHLKAALAQCHCPQVERPAPNMKVPPAKTPHITPILEVIVPETIKAAIINRAIPPIISKMGDML